MWDFSIQTDREARELDLVVVDKKRRTCKIIDFVVAGDSRIEEKEKDKKTSRSKKEVTENLECECEDFTISCRLFRCDT